MSRIGSAAVLEQELNSPPEDGVTTAKWGRSSDSLLVSSWDKTVRLYDGRKNELKGKFELKGAVLDCCFGSDDNSAYCSGLDCRLVSLDLATMKQQLLGSHKMPIKCVEFCEATGLVMSGGWDSEVKLWDSRSPNPLAGSAPMQSGGKIFTMALNGNRLVIGTGNRQVYLYDVRNMGQPEQVRESSLMNQTRCIRIFPNGEGYALSSIEGRVAIEFFDPSDAAQSKKYAFKCHRKSDGKVQTLFPVNALAFHPIHGTFATGGCDGMVNVWDGDNKKRICQYPQYSTSIASLDFNSTGDLLAIAASYTFEEGEKPHPPDAVLVRTVNDAEVRPKLRA